MSSVVEFSNSAVSLTKSPLGIIALFIVLIYGFATLSIIFGKYLSQYVAQLVYFLIIFPLIVFAGFLWLVTNHPDKIYGPSDFKNEENFFKMKMATVASLSVAAEKQNTHGVTEEILDSIVNMVSKTEIHKKSSKNEKWKNSILWVDDQPENNSYERKAFENEGLRITTVLSTNEAIKNLKLNKYAAIISDMGRDGKPQEGYVLLEKLRKSGNKTPYFIYAGSNKSEHKLMALERGAQGSTNQVQELYKMIINRISN